MFGWQPAQSWMRVFGEDGPKSRVVREEWRKIRKRVRVLLTKPQRSKVEKTLAEYIGFVPVFMWPTVAKHSVSFLWCRNNVYVWWGLTHQALTEPRQHQHFLHCLVLFASCAWTGTIALSVLMDRWGFCSDVYCGSSTNRTRFVSAIFTSFQSHFAFFFSFIFIFFSLFFATLLLLSSNEKKKKCHRRNGNINDIRMEWLMVVTSTFARMKMNGVCCTYVCCVCVCCGEEMKF